MAACGNDHVTVVSGLDRMVSSFLVRVYNHIHADVTDDKLGIKKTGCTCFAPTVPMIGRWKLTRDGEPMDDGRTWIQSVGF